MILMRTGGAGLIVPGVQVQQAGGGDCAPFSQIDGVVSNNATFLHLADGIIAWTQAVPSNNSMIKFRIQDASNYWVKQIYQGQQYLIEVIAGAQNYRGSTLLLTLVGTERWAVELNGTTIRIYVNAVLKKTYASATNFSTEDDGKYELLGTGAISNLKTWQLSCRASEGV